MSKTNGSKSFFKTYGFLIFMLTGIVAGCLVGAFAPNSVSYTHLTLPTN